MIYMDCVVASLVTNQLMLMMMTLVCVGGSWLLDLWHFSPVFSTIYAQCWQLHGRMLKIQAGKEIPTLKFLCKKNKMYILVPIKIMMNRFLDHMRSFDITWPKCGNFLIIRKFTYKKEPITERRFDAPSCFWLIWVLWKFNDWEKSTTLPTITIYYWK